MWLAGSKTRIITRTTSILLKRHASSRSTSCLLAKTATALYNKLEKVDDIASSWTSTSGPPLIDDQLLSAINWLHLIEKQSLNDIEQCMRELGVNPPLLLKHLLIATQPLEQPPTFVVYHLFRNRVISVEDIRKTLLLLQYHLPAAEISAQPVLIILAVAKLSEHGMVAPLRSLVERFLSLATATETQYNLLIRAVALSPGSRETSALVIDLMAALARRGFKLDKRTCKALLRPWFNTLDVTQAVQEAMKKAQLHPDESHLVAFLRLMLQTGRKERLGESFWPWMYAAENRTRTSSGLPTRHYLWLSATRTSAFAYRLLDKVIKSDTPESEIAAPMRSHPTKVQLPKYFTQPVPGTLAMSDWIMSLRAAAKDRTISSNALYNIFRQGSSLFPPNVFAYEMAIRGLCDKQDLRKALALWEEFASLCIHVHSSLLGLGVRVLAMSNKPLDALNLLETIYALWVKTDRDPRKSHHVPVQHINQFMTGMRRTGRPDVVFALWDTMHSLYECHPDTFTLNILLGTARWARKFSDTLQGALRGALDELGLSKSSGPETITVQGSSRQAILDQLVALVDPDATPAISGQWHSLPASRVGLRIALQVFFGNWPHLRDLRSPIQALRHSWTDSASSPLSEVFNSFTHDPSGGDSQPSALASLVPDDTPLYSYLYIYPTDMTFRALIDLLAVESLHAEIPVVLVWMQHMRVRPSKTTLATALVHWSEVSMDAPLIQRIKGNAEQNPYTALLAWMEAWVGEQNMPTRTDMASEMSRLSFFKDSQYEENRGLVMRTVDGKIVEGRHHRASWHRRKLRERLRI